MTDQAVRGFRLEYRIQGPERLEWARLKKDYNGTSFQTLTKPLALDLMGSVTPIDPSKVYGRVL